MRTILDTYFNADTIPLSPAQLAQLAAFGTQLLEKNQVMNLTAITEPSAVAQLHFFDCISLTRAVDFSNQRVIDVGCGAGFPGVPLKIAVPSMELTLLDSLNKRIRWLQDEALPEIGVQATCLSGRAEELVQTRREQYDIATSRAVARLNVLCELCLPYVKPGGCFIAMKGAQAEQELQEAKNAIRLLGGKVEQVYAYPVGDATHYAVIVRKVGHTPPAYPRRFAKIKQQPL